jgi:hypothetical protein
MIDGVLERQGPPTAGVGLSKDSLTTEKPPVILQAPLKALNENPVNAKMSDDDAAAAALQPAVTNMDSIVSSAPATPMEAKETFEDLEKQLNEKLKNLLPKDRDKATREFYLPRLGYEIKLGGLLFDTYIITDKNDNNKVVKKSRSFFLNMKKSKAEVNAFLKETLRRKMALDPAKTVPAPVSIPAPMSGAPTQEAIKTSNGEIDSSSKTKAGLSAGIKIGRAVWNNRGINQPITVIKDLGVGSDGKRYVNAEGSVFPVPLDEITYLEETVEQTEPSSVVS